MSFSSVAATGGFVFEDCGGGGVVEGGIHGCLVGTRRHVVTAWGLVGGDEDVDGLAWAYHEDVGG